MVKSHPGSRGKEQNKGYGGQPAARPVDQVDHKQAGQVGPGPLQPQQAKLLPAQVPGQQEQLNPGQVLWEKKPGKYLAFPTTCKQN